MTIIEAMKVLLAASGHEDWYEFAPAERHIITIAAQGTIGRLVSGYERLAPDWSQAPEWAQWYAIGANCKTKLYTDLVRRRLAENFAVIAGYTSRKRQRGR